MVAAHTKVEWRCTTKVSGARFATMAGVSKRPASSADSLASLLRLKPGRAPALVQDLGQCSLMTLTAVAMNQTSTSVITGNVSTTAAVAGGALE